MNTPAWTRRLGIAAFLLVSADALALSAVSVTTPNVSGSRDDRLYSVVNPRGTAGSKKGYALRMTAANGPFSFTDVASSGVLQPGDYYQLVNTTDGSNQAYASSSNSTDATDGIMSMGFSGGDCNMTGGSSCGNMFPPGAPKCTIKIYKNGSSTPVTTCTTIYTGYNCWAAGSFNSGDRCTGVANVNGDTTKFEIVESVKP